jgi:hypothetical protein
MAILDFHATMHELVVAVIAEIVGSEAVEESGGTAVHAFPVNLFISVRVASGLTSTDFHEEATLAQKVFLLRLLAGGLLAVNETTEER